ncbi:wax ester/triacylglycerol synthase domain-containing protein [Rhodococcus kronopolitis]|uniref:diacylglycerol O-acyltransferase n=1 Tax=Rhodococcus kronopolitis TaxID=1460226 RepID=A0ABV9FSG9_9NOCA
MTAEPAEPRDAVFAYVDSPGAGQAMLTAYAFPGTATTAEITAWITARAARIPELRQRMVRVPADLDHPYWVDDPRFAPARHITFHQPGDWAGLCALQARLQGEPFDWGRPLWELHVSTGVHGVGGIEGPATVAGLKIHHAVADGMLSTLIARRLFTDELPAALPSTNDREPSRTALFGRAVAAIPRNLARLAAAPVAIRTVRRELKAEQAQGMWTAPAARRPRTILNEPLGRDRVCDSVFYRFPELRALKDRIGGVSVNDLMLTVVGSALHSYLAEHGGVPDGSLAAGVPISTRGAAAANARNQFSLAYVDLHTDIADPIARTHAIHASMRADQARKLSPATMKFDMLVNSIPGFVVRQGLRVLRALPVKRAPTVGGANTLITNVRRGPADMTLCGLTVAATFGVTPLIGEGGIAHSIGSIGDSVAISFTADPAQLRDAARYTELLRSSFAAIEADIYASTRTEGS